MESVTFLLLVTPFLPVLLPIETLVLLWQEWAFWKYDRDRRWREEGRLWDGRIGGILAQEIVPWGAGALMLFAYLQESYIRLGVYCLLAFLVMCLGSRRFV